jgi:Family of unknown function (DUF6491)
MSSRTFGRLARFSAAAALALGLAGAATAATKEPVPTTAVQPAPYQAVDSFTLLTRPHSWQAIDEDTVIVWTTPWQPYLVQLAYPSHDLPFVETIGITSFGSRVYARFDAVRVAGFRYPIDSIYRMTREEARELTRKS